MQCASYLCFGEDYRGLIKKPTKIYGLSENSYFQIGIFRFLQFREKTFNSTYYFNFTGLQSFYATLHLNFGVSKE